MLPSRARGPVVAPDEPTGASPGRVTLTDAQLREVIGIVRSRSGIALHEGKRELVTTRLQKRMRQLGLRGFAEYLEHLKRDTTGAELTALLDVMTTNFTSFYREPQHFQILSSRVLVELAAKARTSGVRGWCAASSTGEEPYTIAITCLEAGVERLQLVASDISTTVLATARAAIYPLERLRNIPTPVLHRYFERGLGEQAGLARVSAAVRRLIEFRAINLQDQTRFEQGFDFIFCRNVMIYFDRDVQQRVVAMLERNLLPGGYLFIGHSESLNGVTHGLTWVAPAAYRKAVA